MTLFLHNLISGLCAVFGGLPAYYLIDAMRGLVPYLLSVSAARFIYIALADLVPVRRAGARSAHPVSELGLILIGAGTIFSLQSLLHG